MSSIIKKNGYNKNEYKPLFLFPGERQPRFLKQDYRWLFRVDRDAPSFETVVSCPVAGAVFSGDPGTVNPPNDASSGIFSHATSQSGNDFS